jgi:fructoselysine-6-P-deglycase FrlB-like protein
MLQEIREQPGLFREVGEQAVGFQEDMDRSLESIHTLHFVGCGDMDFASRAAAWLAESRGPRVTAHRSMDMRWITPSLTPGDLVIVASFSGRTPRTIEAAMAASKKGCAVWGITGNPESPLTRAVDRVLLLRTGPQEELLRHVYAGYHHVVPQTKTFTSVLLAMLHLLAGAGCISAEKMKSLKSLGDAGARFLPRLEDAVSSFMEKGFRKVERVALLGSGPWHPLAAFGAAKLLEMAFPARCQCLEENNHLEMFITQAEDLIVFLAPDEPSWTRAQELLEPYGRFNALRLALIGPGLQQAEPGFAIDDHGVCRITLSEEEDLVQVFQMAVAIELLTAALGPALGRDIDQWVGGIRTKLIEEMGLNLVRGSKILL